MTRTTATVTYHPAFAVGTVEPRLFGSFVEHLGRGVYGGLVDPGDACSDQHGFRSDVLELVRELGVTTVRYPGGNFVSAYNWRDGIGPGDQRPSRLDPAWHSTETNLFGTDEFLGWCEMAAVEPMLAVNLGTRGEREAMELVEYVNHPGGTSLSDERAKNGHPAPYNVKLWCLGNEMDGPWQVGHRAADEYAALAVRTGLAMRMLDPTLELVVCGSSNDRMSTFSAWEHDVLTRCGGMADYISCHQYFRNDGDLDAFLASGAHLHDFIDVVAGAIVQARAATRSSRQTAISFDEWNVWDWAHHEDHPVAAGHWPVAPRLLEDRYTVADAVVVGDVLCTFLQRADVVKAASLAQLVNVISPIVAEHGRPAWRQTIFYPFAAVSKSAGRMSLKPHVDAPPTSAGVPLLSSAATLDRTTGDLDLFLAHRGTSNSVEVVCDLSAFGPVEVIQAEVLSDHDWMAKNSTDNPTRVVPSSFSTRLEEGMLRFELPAVAWCSLRLRKTRTQN